MLKEENLTGKIIGLAMKVHSELGPGFKENVYHKAMIIALNDGGLPVETEVPFIVKFDGKEAGKFRIDLVVNKKIIVEIKALGGKMPKIFQAQVVSYLKASKLSVGLLLNFGNSSLEFKRFAY